MLQMLAIVLCSFTAFIPAPTRDVAADGPVNGDFESGPSGQAPQGWFVPEMCKTAGFEADTSTKKPHGGARCAVLTYGGKGEPEGMGNLMQSVDATPYRGKRVRMHAAVRVSDGGHAQLWLRVDGPGEQSALLDNMNDRPIRSRDWAEYAITGEVGDSARSLAFGLMLFEGGHAYLDDFSIDIVGAAGEGNAAPRALEDRALENLVAFARLFGYVRHFHPSDQAASAKWDELAITGVGEVEPARNANELAEKLTHFFDKLAPTVQVFVTDKKPALPKELAWPAKADDLQLVRWKHTGFGTGNSQSIYRSVRENEPIHDNAAPEDWRKPEEVFEAELGGGVSCRVPLILFKDGDGTLPHASKDEEHKAALPASFMPNGADRATRLADVILAWNVFEHFYPYFDVVKTDWPRELERALKSAAIDPDAPAFLRTLRVMVAALHDGHGNVQHSCDSAWAMPPITWDWVGDKLVITSVPELAPKQADSEFDVQRGDIVLSIDGEPTAKAFERVAAQISGATPQWIRNRALIELMRGVQGSQLHLELATSRTGHERAEVVFQRDQRARAHETLPDKIAQLEPGFWYVDLDRITDADFEGAVEDLSQAAGVVFDLRGYPSQLSPIVIAHLIDEPVRCARWNIPAVTQPDHVAMEFAESDWLVEPKTPRFLGKAAFITGGGAISYAETYMGIIEHYKLAAIVGGPTAGTNGNINPFKLPGGYQITWTGMKVLKHDGSQHHGVGIVPTIPASRTVAGIAAGRDELLERALEAVRP